MAENTVFELHDGGGSKGNAEGLNDTERRIRAVQKKLRQATLLQVRQLRTRLAFHSGLSCLTPPA